MAVEALQEGTGNYIKIVEDNNIETVSDRMISIQKICGLLPMEIRWINGHKEYLYDITSKITFERYLETVDFSKDDIVTIFRQIIEIKERLEEYLLDGENLAISSDMIFVEKNELVISGIYSQDKFNGNIDALSRLLETIMHYMNKSDKELVFFVYSLHRVTKEDNCTWSDIKENLYGYDAQNCYNDSSYQKSTEANSANSKVDYQNNRKDIYYGGSKSGYQNIKRDEYEEKMQKKFHKSDLKCQLTKRNDDKNIKSLEKRKSAKESRIERKMKKISYKDYIFSGISFVVGILIPIVLYFCGIFNKSISGRIDVLKLVGACALFVGVGVYVAYRLLPEKKFVFAGKKEREEEVYDDIKLHVCLIPRFGKDNSIVIGHFPFSVGLSEEKVDSVINAEGVEKVHARFENEGASVYVIDFETDSGTFWNGERLVPWEKKLLKDGDFLKIGDREFVVEIT